MPPERSGLIHQARPAIPIPWPVAVEEGNSVCDSCAVTQKHDKGYPGTPDAPAPSQLLEQHFRVALVVIKPALLYREGLDILLGEAALPKPVRGLRRQYEKVF